MNWKNVRSCEYKQATIVDTGSGFVVYGYGVVSGPWYCVDDAIAWIEEYENKA